MSTVRYLSQFLGLTVSAAGALNITRRFADTVVGTDQFSLHTASQHRKHRFSGMHEPFIPSPEQQKFFHEHFPEYADLLPTSLESVKKMRALDTSVKISSLASCNAKKIQYRAGTVVVGGPPALISSANQRDVTYICNFLGSAIWKGSAFHLETDGATEAPTPYLPSSFILRQCIRLLFQYESLHSAEKTGHFSWRTINWDKWIFHPEYWGEGFRIARAFQRFNRSTTSRDLLVREVAERCIANQAFYEQLNADLDGRLFLPGKGALLIARTKEQEQALHARHRELEKEGKGLQFLSREQMQERYGFVPEGVAFAIKGHDIALSPHFVKLISQRIEKLGGTVINGTLTEIFVDNPDEGGIIQYKTPNGMKHYVSFSHLVCSLGSQRILDRDGLPLFDAVTARGVSALVLLRIPQNCELPPILVCGDTNNVTLLSEAVETEIDGQKYRTYLARLTAAACITPTIAEEESSYYDGTAAIGLISAVRSSLNCHVEVLSVSACDRQVSQYGQSHWMTAPPQGKETRSLFSLQPRGSTLKLGTFRNYLSRIIFHIGAGGGGLTLGPAQPPKTDPTPTQSTKT